MATDKPKTEETKAAAIELPATLDMASAEKYAGKENGREFFKAVAIGGGYGDTSALITTTLDIKGLGVAASDERNPHRQLSKDAFERVQAAFEKFKA